VGAEAYSPTILSIKQQYLGSENQHNIYSAELTAIEIAVNIAQTCQNNYKQCVIYADSQAAIKATLKPGRQSEQSILCSLLSSIDNLISSQGIDLHIAWIPGHRDIEGNEMADKAAKAAAQSRGMNAMPFKHKSLNARVNLIKQTIKKEWTEDWKTAKGDARHLRRITNKTQVKRKHDPVHHCQYSTSSRTASKTANGSLFAKPISPPLWHRRLSPMCMQQRRDRKCGTLPHSLPQI